jgi:hypothetical protein
VAVQRAILIDRLVGVDERRRRRVRGEDESNLTAFALPGRPMVGFVERVDRGQSTLFPARLDDYVAEVNIRGPKEGSYSKLLR